MTALLRFDPDCITARDLAETLRRIIAESGIPVAAVGASVGVTDGAVHNWLRGDNLRQPVQLFAVLDSLGYEVVFRKRQRPRKQIRLV